MPFYCHLLRPIEVTQVDWLKKCFTPMSNCRQQDPVRQINSSGKKVNACNKGAEFAPSNVITVKTAWCDCCGKLFSFCYSYLYMNEQDTNC